MSNFDFCCSQIGSEIGDCATAVNHARRCACMYVYCACTIRVCACTWYVLCGHGARTTHVNVSECVRFSVRPCTRSSTFFAHNSAISAFFVVSFNVFQVCVPGIFIPGIYTSYCVEQEPVSLVVKWHITKVGVGFNIPACMEYFNFRTDTRAMINTSK